MLYKMNWSQITVMTAVARATALPIPSVYSIRKNMTETEKVTIQLETSFSLFVL
jgi:hypothetical protein